MWFWRHGVSLQYAVWAMHMGIGSYSVQVCWNLGRRRAAVPISAVGQLQLEHRSWQKSHGSVLGCMWNREKGWQPSDWSKRNSHPFQKNTSPRSCFQRLCLLFSVLTVKRVTFGGTYSIRYPIILQVCPFCWEILTLISQHLLELTYF